MIRALLLGLVVMVTGVPHPLVAVHPSVAASVQWEQGKLPRATADSRVLQVGERLVVRATGRVVGFRLAGVEPDGDPLDQVVLQTSLSPSGRVPRLHLIVDTYLENFTPDTTPILPDLLHPTRDAQNLGGFLQGKALLTDDAGDTLYLGSFLAEAFLNNSNHMVATLDGTGAARGGHAQLKGAFSLRKNGLLDGRLSGHITIPAPALRKITAHHNSRMRPVSKIISGVTVKKHPMVGRATKSSAAPLPTGYGPAPSTPQRRISPLTIMAGVGAALSFLLAGLLWWWQRRTAPSVTS